MHLVHTAYFFSVCGSHAFQLSLLATDILSSSSDIRRLTGVGLRILLQLL